MSEFDFATRIKRIEAELMALKIAHGSGQGATVYDSEITIKQGGVTKGSFTVNQSSDETIELDAGGGSEPNDGTLTIQRNGTNIATFTANQSSNSTANITVPTTVAELSDSGDYIKDSDLSSSTSSTSTTTAANSLAVKNTYDLAATKSAVSFTQSLSSGTAIGNLSIDGTSTTLYAPTPAGAATSNYVWHGTCSTATATAAKVVTLDDATGFTLADGVMISITFANSNINRSATLNVGGTGAKDIIDYTLSDTNTHDGAAIWQSGETVLFSYHSGEDAWERVGGAPTYLSEGGYWDFSVGDVLILSGVASANSSATTDVQVNFRKTFADPPRVFLTNNFNESGGSLWWAYTKSITTTGFTFRSGYTNITGTGGGGNSSSSISWLAIGRIAGAT